MDHFGIGNMVVGASRACFTASRGTGRTTSMVESLKSGDTAVFLTSREAYRVKRLCADRGVDINIVVYDPRNFMSCGAKGRVILDHSFVEGYYMLAIERARAEIDHLQRDNGPTELQAREVSKWVV